MAKLNRSADGKHLVLIGRYDPGLIEDLKREVPPHAREWRPTAKCWRIAPEYESIVRSLIE